MPCLCFDLVCLIFVEMVAASTYKLYNSSSPVCLLASLPNLFPFLPLSPLPFFGALYSKKMFQLQADISSANVSICLRLFLLDWFIFFGGTLSTCQSLSQTRAGQLIRSGWWMSQKLCRSSFIFFSCSLRPTSYIVATGFRWLQPPVVDYLLSINDRLNSLKVTMEADVHKATVDTGQQVDVIHAVPEALMAGSFAQYLAQSNTHMAQRQLFALRKIHNFIRVCHGADAFWVLWPPNRRQCQSPKISKRLTLCLQRLVFHVSLIGSNLTVRKSAGHSAGVFGTVGYSYTTAGWSVAWWQPCYWGG